MALKGSEERRRVGICRDCGNKEYRDTCEWYLASRPRCSTCGGTLVRGKLHGLIPKPKSKKAHRKRVEAELEQQLRLAADHQNNPTS